MTTLRGATVCPWFEDWLELEPLWEEFPGAADICVAVLDGPVDFAHPALAGLSLSVLPTLSSADARQVGSIAHGTAVASIVFGIAPGCRGLLVPVLEDQPDAAHVVCSQLNLARGIIQAVEAGAHVLNVSAGELSPSGSAHPLLADAVQFAASRRVLVVAAAGNDGCDCLHVPGALPSVLAVGAMDANGRPLASSNWGGGYQTNGILAPGAAVRAAVSGGGFELRSGTSYACAIVSGVAALLLSAQLRRGGRVDPLEVGAILIRVASRCAEEDPKACRPFLAGRLNVGEALREVGMMSSSVGQGDLRENGVQAADGSPAGELPAPATANIAASDCGCGCAPGACTCSTEEKGAVEPPGNTGVAGQLVYALGTLGYDFGTEARRNSIREQMGVSASPYEPEQLLAFLDKNPWDAQAVHWTLSLDATPIYLVQPRGAFAGAGYERLREFLREQTEGRIERVSVPGAIIGHGRLASGQMLPAIWPDLRGMYSWNTTALMRAVGRQPPKDKDKDGRDDLEGFLDRVYYGLRNLGLSSADRAINYAATNALNVAQVFESAAKERMQLDEILVERSPLCRPESDCWDVNLMFFDPERQMQRARRSYRFTVDVSDICPVMVGPVRSWPVR